MHEDKTDFDLAVGNTFVNLKNEIVKVINNKSPYITFKVIETSRENRLDLTYSLHVDRLNDKFTYGGNALSHMVNKPEKEENIAEPMPEWAYCGAPKDQITLGQQVCTKDGRICGNGVIVDIYFNTKTNTAIFVILTDAGNIRKYTVSELYNNYNLGKYILNTHPGDPNDSKLEEYTKSVYHG